MNRLVRSIPTLNFLATVVDEGSINKAAQVLNITQPALTRSIKRLEHSLGVPLLDRSAKGVSLTTYGAVLMARATAIKAELRRAISEIEALKGNAAGVVRVGATPLVLTHFLPPALEIFHRELPAVAVKVTEGARPSLLAQLRLGDLDLVISTMSFEEDHELIAEPLFDLDICVVVRPDHRLAAKSPLKLKDLADCQWILPRADSGFYRRLEREFKKAGATPPAALIEVSSQAATKSLVLATDLVAILPFHTVRTELADGDLVALEGDWRFERRSVTAFYRKSISRVPAAEQLVHYLDHSISNADAFRPARANVE